jgi:hypothetical protein
MRLLGVLTSFFSELPAAGLFACPFRLPRGFLHLAVMRIHLITARPRHAELILLRCHSQVDGRKALTGSVSPLRLLFPAPARPPRCLQRHQQLAQRSSPLSVVCCTKIATLSDDGGTSGDGCATYKHTEHVLTAFWPESPLQSLPAPTQRW